MKDLHLPRVVIVSRPTRLDLLVQRWGTVGQARFHIQSSGHDFTPFERAQDSFETAMTRVTNAIPMEQRRARIDRADLDRFLFNPDDIIVIVGQDGLVPNAAKYLHGQRVIGINPDPESYDGILVPHAPKAAPALLAWTREQSEEFHIQRRTMALATRDDQQSLLALNEIFIGHKTHQSARYTIADGNRQERHSSSGVICATGTGSTGWARSISEQRGIETLPNPEDPSLAWFVREPFPSVYTQTAMDHGWLNGNDELVITSEMGYGGVIFADGIESDWIEFGDGHQVTVGIASQTLNLIIAA